MINVYKFKVDGDSMSVNDRDKFEKRLTSWVSVSTTAAMKLPGFKYRSKYGSIADWMDGYRWKDVFGDAQHEPSLITVNWIIYGGKVCEFLAVEQAGELSFLVNDNGTVRRVYLEDGDVMYGSMSDAMLSDYLRTDGNAEDFNVEVIACMAW